ncbi:putative GTPase activator [Dioszegia hungarica]|uniref:GTPase activator n=1 Tax=Dioszegia hungarica TaxID=4972 RepID=A0AA38H6J0_9TREE|nr:putative GTPase activator [Dioszegia hungarica]KAI9634596.1 putative GTPase activator [Dioszegia hungarica]
MPPILLPPPPAGIQTPTDDWTDDPSFDLSLSPSLSTSNNLITSPKSSPSHSQPHSRSHSHSSSSSSRGSGGHMNSPLRQIYTSKPTLGKGLARRDTLEEEAEDGFDFPEDLYLGDGDDKDGGTLKLSGMAVQQAKPARAGMGTIGLSGTVIGVGPQGVGTITRLGPSTSASKGAVKSLGGKMMNGASEKGDLGFDGDDMDGFDDDFDLPSKPLSLAKAPTGLALPPLKSRVSAPADALDELDFDFDDELGEAEDQATLKAGATIKALLPPPKPKSSSISTPLNNSSAPADDDDMDLVLPLSMTNLTLATASTRSQSSSKHLKPRASTSTIHTDWDSPSPSSASGSGPSSGRKAIWDDSSPWGKRPGQSETSGTSTGLSELGTPVRKGRAVDVEVEGEEEGEEMMMGLVLPEVGFFEGRREGELNRILDKKRKPQDAFVSAVGQDQPGWGRKAGLLADESMEDGLLFEDPGRELTGHRLRQQRKVRGMAGGTVKKGSGGKVSSAVGSWEKAREAGWGRHTPLPTVPREREREKERVSGGLGSGGIGGSGVSVGHRSHSTTARERDSAPRTRTQSMAPPPIPSIPSTPSSRLRHQKSHYQVSAPSPSPTHSIARKQSLASLQDALVQQPPPVPTVERNEQDRSRSETATPSKERYHASTSRLTMGTSSSRAKVRPPISAIFPRSEHPSSTGGMYTNHSASSSSTSISGLTRASASAPGQSSGTGRRVSPVLPQSQMVVPLGGRRKGGPGEKKRNWGDGTELEGIEDLEVDEPTVRAGSGMSGHNGIGLGKPSRKGEYLADNAGDSLGRSAVPPPKPAPEADKRKKSNGGSVSKRRPRKAAGLIKHLGTVDKKKVVGDMTWNPATLRWEGNESILRDFDASPSGTPTTSSAPTRPALITHYTGGVVPLATSSSTPSSSGTMSLTAASTIRIVGDMQFDPERMCWVSIGEEEPDPFADMADDEDDEGGRGGSTITRATGRKLVSVGTGLGVSAGSGWSSRLASESSAGGSVISWEERVRVREGEVSQEMWRECKEAEERHRREMKGWGGGLGSRGQDLSREERRDRERREEKRLWEIRYLAMRS